MARQASKHPGIDRDIEEIFNFIAERSPRAAIAVVKAIHLSINEIEELPEGAPRYVRASLNTGDLRRKSVRPYHSYSIIYQLTKTQVRFLYVHHSRRDLEQRMLGEGRQ